MSTLEPPTVDEEVGAYVLTMVCAGSRRRPLFGPALSGPEEWPQSNSSGAKPRRGQVAPVHSISASKLQSSYAIEHNSGETRREEKVLHPTRPPNTALRLASLYNRKTC